MSVDRLVRLVAPGVLPPDKVVVFDPAKNLCQIDADHYLTFKGNARRERAMWRAKTDLTVQEVRNIR